MVPGALRAIAQHLKLDLQTEGIFWGDYCYFAGVTGLESFQEEKRDDLALLEIRTTGELGTSAMERWAVHLEDDAQYEGFSDSQWKLAHSNHGGTAGDLAERRALASTVLELARRFLPEAADELEMAGASFQGMHDTVYEIWETAAKTGRSTRTSKSSRIPRCGEPWQLSCGGLRNSTSGAPGFLSKRLPS